ncbi:MAG: GIY-YIG nuclease family protein [Acidimicrobiia bacterium]
MELPPDTALQAVIVAEISKCGIYVLERFDIGEFYVGQSIQFFGRFSDHARRWEGEITAVWFAPHPKELLDEAELDTIARLVADGKRLRNIDGVALPIRSDALDFHVEEAAIEEWLSGKTDELIIDRRGKIAVQRLKMKENYDKLAAHEAFENHRSNYWRICSALHSFSSQD